MCCHETRDPVTVAEVNEFLSDTLDITRAGATTPLVEQIAHQQRKAELLSRIASELDTAHAYATAADAWDRVVELRAKAARIRAAEAGDA